MFLKIIKIENFRRLRSVTIDFDKEISIFVGANNSGKTSVAEAIELFLSAARDKVSLYDINASQWREIERFANREEGVVLPEMSIDLWFEVGRHDLHHVIDLLPSLAWQGTHVGLRISFSPASPDELLGRFQARFRAVQESLAAAEGANENDNEFVPSPRNLTEYLTEEISREYEFKYFVLDRAKFDDDFGPHPNYEPLEIVRDQGRTGKDVINSLLRVDFLPAQRHLSDTSGGSRAEELSRYLSRFYTRNLKKHAEDLNAIRALAESKALLNQHLEQVFTETLERLADLGYPGFANPRLVIKSALNPATVMNSQDGAHVHYALDDLGLTLPDKYNGLGFKNLIYMVVDLLDRHAQWLDIEDKRPPLHLVFVEEPETHLHAQLQQVFVKKVLDILIIEAEERDQFGTQLVLTTHSPHILYERGFRPIRYFRRENRGAQQSTTVLNLSEFYHRTENPSRDFLERYLKLTHCDLFFADAAILVEGNVERLLMPQMIDKAAPDLKSAYLTVLEIGGAFSHRFQSLIEFLGITSLIVTDLDSVTGPGPDGEGAGEEGAEFDPFEEIDESDDGNGPKAGSTCRVEVPDAVTSNQMLIKWLPRKARIADLLETPDEEKTAVGGPGNLPTVRVSYPTNVTLLLGEETVDLAGRTLEEAFAFENLVFCQDIANKDLKLRVKSNDAPGIELVAERLHKRIHGKNFKKTDFALALLAKDPALWAVPGYIGEGLEWLEAQLTPDDPLVEPVAHGTP